jgi:hypothetical protein
LAQEAPSSQEVLDRLAGLDQRLAQLERMVVEIHAHLVKG